MLDPSRTIVIGNEFRHPLRDSARQWIAATFPGRYFGVAWDYLDLIAFRNRAVRDVALPQAAAFDAEWAIFIDNDVTITHPGLENFLAIDADVASCRCRMRTPTPWSQPGSFHTTFWFARLDVFRVLTPPWFQFVYSPDGCDMLACECQFFAERAIAARFSVRSGGWCGHGCEAKWCG